MIRVLKYLHSKVPKSIYSARKWFPDVQILLLTPIKAFLQTSLSEGKEVCQQTAFKVRVRVRVQNLTVKNWRGFVTLALVNCICLKLKWMNHFKCTAHCMQCDVQLNY